MDAIINYLKIND